MTSGVYDAEGTSRTFGYNAPVNSKTAHPPPGQTPGHLTFWKNFGQIPRYIASLDGQMPRRLLIKIVKSFLKFFYWQY